MKSTLKYKPGTKLKYVGENVSIWNEFQQDSIYTVCESKNWKGSYAFE